MPCNRPPQGPGGAHGQPATDVDTELWRNKAPGYEDLVSLGRILGIRPTGMAERYVSVAITHGTQSMLPRGSGRIFR